MSEQTESQDPGRPKTSRLFAIDALRGLGLLILFLPCLWVKQFKQRQPANSALRFL